MLSDRCLEELFAGSRDGILLLDAEGIIVWGNAIIGEFLELPTADLLGKNFHSLLLGGKRIFAQPDEVARLLQQTRQNSAPAQISCTKIADGSQHARSLHLTIQPAGRATHAGYLLLRLSSGCPLPTAASPTESRKENRSPEQRFLTLFDGISDGILHLAADHTILLANRAAVADAGQECAGKKCFAVFRRRDAPCGGCPLEKSLKSGREEVGQIVTTHERILEERAFPIPGTDGEAGNSFLVHMRDQTETLRLQEIALQTMPLASLGELAAGVAHEINNPATGIINCAQLLFDRLAGRDRDIAQRILREGERISAIVRNLLSLARVGDEKSPGVKIEEELADLLSLTRTQMRKERITLVQRLAPELPPVTANSQQLRQVFLNLINNARYALNQKYPGFSEEKVLEIHGETRPGGIRFSFHDYGTGIPAPILGKIFRPFFTTKPAGRGTGLGLSISRSIISDHGGTLTIDSVEGEYTRAIVDLPIAN